MREQIERVIAELQLSANVCNQKRKYEKSDAYNAAVFLLKEVLNSETHDTNSANGHGENDSGNGQTD